MDKTKLGSLTAKGGFNNEKTICNKFNNWKKDTEAKLWLEIMGYEIDKIDEIKAIQIPVRIKKNESEKYNISESNYNEIIRYKKADIQIKLIIKIGEIFKIENLSLKKANSDADYNQIDKRTVDTYKDMWGYKDNIAYWLKLFTGEINPFKLDLNKKNQQKINISKLRDKNKKRLYLDEIPKNECVKIIDFFNTNRILIVSDILKGRGGLSADWILVTKFNKSDNTTTWSLKDINTAMNFFGNGEVKISPRGSLYIGKITMQRKGGTPDPTKLQFKIHPCDLFKMEGL